MATARLRWRTTEQDGGGLFSLEEVADRHIGQGEFRGMEFLHVHARSLINTLPASRSFGFRHTINVYRGCSHACTYCFARPTHAYLNLNIAADFEQKLVVKVNAIEVLRAELRAGTWRGEHIAMGTNTDPYQPAEGKYHLTQGIVAELLEARNPFSILTKSTLVVRDRELLAQAAKQGLVQVSFSIGTLDREVWRLTEPGTPPPEQRLRALTRLSAMGIPCGVLIAPILPGLSDSTEQIKAVASACLEAGAISITPIALHLRGEVRKHYLSWLSRECPSLLGLYAERFRKGAYQDRSEQARVAAIVAEVTGEQIDPSGRRERFVEALNSIEPAERPGEQPQLGEQLRLI